MLHTGAPQDLLLQIVGCSFAASDFTQALIHDRYHTKRQSKSRGWTAWLELLRARPGGETPPNPKAPWPPWHADARRDHSHA